MCSEVGSARDCGKPSSLLSSCNKGEHLDSLWPIWLERFNNNQIISMDYVITWHRNTGWKAASQFTVTLPSPDAKFKQQPRLIMYTGVSIQHGLMDYRETLLENYWLIWHSLVLTLKLWGALSVYKWFVAGHVLYFPFHSPAFI